MTGGAAATGLAATLTCQLTGLGDTVSTAISWWDGTTELGTQGDTGEYSAVKLQGHDVTESMILRDERLIVLRWY